MTLKGQDIFTVLLSKTLVFALLISCLVTDFAIVPVQYLFVTVVTQDSVVSIYVC